MSSKRAVCRAGGIVAALFVVFAHSGSGQSSQPPPNSQQPPFRAGTNFVRVDVFATRDGIPVENLMAEDFEILEDGAAQKIETFEHVVIEPAGPQAARVEPSSPTRANQLAADPHRRVFVIYLDTAHVDVIGSHSIKEPLIAFLTKALGADDLVGIMTPDMSPDQITFGRKTEVIEEGLRRNWAWGRRSSLQYDEQEQKYEACFGPTSALARELIARRRERIVLDSLRDMIRHLAAIREGRTAVLAVTDGWVLYRPNSELTNLRTDPLTGRQADPVPGMPPPIGVGSGGTLTRDPNNPYGSIRNECERDQMELAMADHDQYFRLILGEANRANVSFYPIDPRGLPAFDSDIGPDPPLPLDIDRAMLRTREDSLRVLAANTDGIALLGSNDLNKQMGRLAADLTSYYLIGYSSTNTKLDGGFRRIRVRVKRAGIEVRARSGYRAASAAELAAAQKALATPSQPARSAALSAELGNLERATRTADSHGSARIGSTERSRSVDVPGEPILFRKGPTTGNQVQRASGREFSRTERLHIEMLPGSASRWTGALLDRMGKTVPIPVTTGERIDATTGQRWLTADLVLAPLGAGEYAIELTTEKDGEQQKILRAIRVTQ